MTYKHAVLEQSQQPIDPRLHAPPLLQSNWPPPAAACPYNTNRQTRHTASTSMYSLTFCVRVTTPPQYGRNGTAHEAGMSILLPGGESVFASMRSACGVQRAVGLADYRWALPRISIVLPQQRNPCTDCKSAQ